MRVCRPVQHWFGGVSGRVCRGAPNAMKDTVCEIFGVT